MALGVCCVLATLCFFGRRFSCIVHRASCGCNNTPVIMLMLLRPAAPGPLAHIRRH